MYTIERKGIFLFFLMAIQILIFFSCSWGKSHNLSKIQIYMVGIFIFESSARAAYAIALVIIVRVFALFKIETPSFNAISTEVYV